MSKNLDKRVGRTESQEVLGAGMDVISSHMLNSSLEEVKFTKVMKGGFESIVVMAVKSTMPNEVRTDVWMTK